MNFIVRNLNVVGIIDNINCYNYFVQFFPRVRESINTIDSFQF